MFRSFRTVVFSLQVKVHFLFKKKIVKKLLLRLFQITDKNSKRYSKLILSVCQKKPAQILIYLSKLFWKINCFSPVQAICIIITWVDHSGCVGLLLWPVAFIVLFKCIADGGVSLQGEKGSGKALDQTTWLSAELHSIPP